jgi:hypothetical protein
MRLSDMQRQTRSSGSGRGTALETNQEVGTIRNATAYTHPINALFQGRPVTLLGTGDIVGMSPCEKFVDEEGRLDWAPSEEFTVDDRHVIPQSLETRQRLQQRTQERSTR